MSERPPYWTHKAAQGWMAGPKKVAGAKRTECAQADALRAASCNDCASSVELCGGFALALLAPLDTSISEDNWAIQALVHRVLD